jgi:hypothetical protein
MGSGIDRCIEDDNAMHKACRHEYAARSSVAPVSRPITRITCALNGTTSTVECTDGGQSTEDVVRMAYQAIVALGFSPCNVADWFVDVGIENQKSED